MKTPPQMPFFGAGQPGAGQPGAGQPGAGQPGAGQFVPDQRQQQQIQQQQVQQQLQAAMGQLSLGIYSQLATACLTPLNMQADLPPLSSSEQKRLRRLARDSQTAARCYFEGIGVIQQEKE